MSWWRAAPASSAGGGSRLYAALPVAIALLLWQAARVDPDQRGNWRDFLVLAALGLAVDLRWFEGAWPAHLAIFNKILLLDAGIYGFVLIRQLEEPASTCGCASKIRDRPARGRFLHADRPGAGPEPGLSACRIASGRAWGRLPAHGSSLSSSSPSPRSCSFAAGCRICWKNASGRYGALFLTACLFGLAHFNKRTTSFNWRYVLLAALAGIFYGRAWRRERRVGASAVTHATVDAIWSLWLR